MAPKRNSQPSSGQPQSKASEEVAPPPAAAREERLEDIAADIVAEFDDDDDDESPDLPFGGKLLHVCSENHMRLQKKKTQKRKNKRTHLIVGRQDDTVITVPATRFGAVLL